MKHLLITALLSFGLLFLAACDSGDPGIDDLPDNFSEGDGGATVSGGVSGTFTGAAFWTVYYEEGEEPLFILMVLDGPLEQYTEQNHDMVLIGGESERPATGSYQLADFMGDQEGIYDAFFVRTRPNSWTFVMASEGGQMNVATSNAQRVAGTFNFSGSVWNMNGPTAQNASVQGGFNAIYVDPDVIPDDEGPLASARSMMVENSHILR
jgi:hypothetical protein